VSARSSSGATLEQTFKGRIDVQGAFNDYLEADVKQSVAANALGSGAGAVSMKLVGSIKTSSETFTYNESINVTAGGKLTVAAAASR
jgi:lipid-binding SYLF domain-containing protein